MGAGPVVRPSLEDGDLLAGNAGEIKPGIGFAFDFDSLTGPEIGQILAPADESRASVIAEKDCALRFDERDCGVQMDGIVSGRFGSGKISQVTGGRQRRQWCVLGLERERAERRAKKNGGSADTTSSP